MKERLSSAVTRALLDLPTQPRLQALYGDDQSRYLQASAVENNYRLALCLASIVLFSGIAYTLIRLKNATIALHRANATLEPRVNDRTAKEVLQRIAVTDELTGLYTRRFLFEGMEKQVASIGRHKRGFSCLLLDVDYFKKVNATYGHGEGDRVLKQVAEVPRASMRQSDIVGRPTRPFTGPRTRAVTGARRAEKLSISAPTRRRSGRSP